MFLFDSNFLFLIVLLNFAMGLGFVLIVLPLILIQQEDYNEKVSPYECGFNPFEEARTPFEVHFYLVSILFVIFDLEVSYIFPWVLNFYDISLLGFWSLIWFLIILSLGFTFEWFSGALNWI